jgi:hypothetical protein
LEGQQLALRFHVFSGYRNKIAGRSSTVSSIIAYSRAATQKPGGTQTLETTPTTGVNK